MPCILFEYSGLIQFQELIDSQFLYFTFGSLHKRAVGHTMPLGKNRGDITIQSRWNIHRKLIIA